MSSISSAASIPSIGSSPSAVAEAMGKMINESLKVAERLADRSGRPAPARRGAEQASASDGRTVGAVVAVRRGGRARADAGGAPAAAAGDRRRAHRARLARRDAARARPRLHARSRALRERRLQRTRRRSHHVLRERRAGEGAPRAGRRACLLGEVLARPRLARRRRSSTRSPTARRGWASSSASTASGTTSCRATRSPRRSSSQLVRQGRVAREPAARTRVRVLPRRDPPRVVGRRRAAARPARSTRSSRRVRVWNDRARVRATLNRIGKHPLMFHEDADLENLAADRGRAGRRRRDRHERVLAARSSSRCASPTRTR